MNRGDPESSLTVDDEGRKILPSSGLGVKLQVTRREFWHFPRDPTRQLKIMIIIIITSLYTIVS